MTTHVDVYGQLKREITHFDLRPGVRLVEGDLSERYGVSRTPVREALRQLELEGLVVATDGRGRAVRDIVLRDYEDVSDVRFSIEDLAVLQACERATDEEITRLRDTWDEPTAAITDGSYVHADERFHTGVAELSQNGFLCDTLSRVNDRIRIIRITDFTDDERIPVVRREHDDILAAMLERDTDSARALMRSHIDRSQSNIRSLITRAIEQTYFDAPRGTR